MKKSVLAILLSVVLLFCMGCQKVEPRDMVFTVDDFSITLNEQFEEYDGSPYQKGYTDGIVEVRLYSVGVSTFTNKKEPTFIPVSAESFCDYYIGVTCEMGACEPQVTDDYAFCEYSELEGEEIYKYFCTFHKNEDQYLVTQYKVLADDFEQQRDNIDKWIHSVVFL